MVMSKKLKAIAIATLAVCAVSALSASAEHAAPHWTKGGAAFTGTAKLTESVVLTKVVSTESQPSSTLTVPGLLNLTCTSLKAKGAEIFESTKGSAEALTFEGCIVSSLPTTCQVKSVGAAVGTITTNSLTIKLIEPPATDAVFSPVTEIVVEVRVEAKLGKSCALVGTYKIMGDIALKIETGTNAPTLGGNRPRRLRNRTLR